jgi:hypothetical protein
MKKLFCDLDCARIKETFCFTSIEHYKRQITRAIHKSREDTKDGDVLQLHIKSMQGILLQHVWSELLALKNCDVEIILEDLANEADIIFILNHVLKNHTQVKIKEISIIKINSFFPEESAALIKRYNTAINAMNIVTNIYASKELYLNDDNQYLSQTINKKSVHDMIKNGMFFLRPPVTLPQAEVPAPVPRI